MADGLASWLYRRQITIDNSGNAQGLTNYQVRVPLTAATFDFSHSNGDDIRFTDSDGVTLLPHWTESYSPNFAAGSIFVSVPSIPASSVKTIHMFYGNPEAPSRNAGSKTFSFYDGFERLRNAAAPQVTPTYEGSGQAVHPDVVVFPEPWNGFTYWMAMTPYPNGLGQFENPSILASNDGISWVVPPGVVNPLEPMPPCDHNCDPDMIYNAATNELWMYYLDTRRGMSCNGHQSQPYYNHNFLRLIKSADGVNWSSPITVIDWPLASNPLYVSPSIVKVGNTWHLWAVNSSTFTIRTSSSTNGVNFGASQAVNIAQQAWHIDVRFIPSKNQYWMMLSYPSANGVIRFARSTDRVNWTTFSPTVLAGTPGTWDSEPYRATFVYDDGTDLLKLWYSAHDSSFVWHIGHTSVEYASLQNQLVPGGGWTRKQGTGTWSTSTEQVRRGTLSAKLVQQAGTSMWLSKGQPIPNNFYLEWDMHDDLDGSAFKMVRCTNAADNRVGVGVWTGASAGNYVFHDKAFAYTTTSVPRTAGWHKFGLLLRSDSSVTFFVDNQDVGTITGQFANASQIQVEGYTGGLSSFHVDDLRVRKFTSPEPAVSVGAEQQNLSGEVVGVN